jgi:hypothetical protein
VRCVQDINDLRNRSGFVTASQKCDLCSQPVLTRQFYLFPCTHVFHVDCVVNEHKSYLEKHSRIRAAVLSGAAFDPTSDSLLRLEDSGVSGSGSMGAAFGLGSSSKGTLHPTSRPSSVAHFHLSFHAWLCCFVCVR